jgi:hypothetical protein
VSREEIIRAVQGYCADVAERDAENEIPNRVQGTFWNEEDGRHVAELLNQDDDPWGLFRFIDEKTGDSMVGYRTRDGREWFHVLRQMRNTVGSGLLENLGH